MRGKILSKPGIKTALFIGVAFCMAGNLGAQDIQLFDLGQCGFKITQVDYHKSLPTDKGKLKPKSGQNVLAAVTLKGTTASAGTFIQTPDLYTAIFNYRRTIGLSRSVAIGSKGTSKSTGEYTEVWFSSPDVRLLCETGADEEIVLYIVFDIPKSVTDFEVQIPAFVRKN